jgi:arylsulfatase A-like enzyme
LSLAAAAALGCGASGDETPTAVFLIVIDTLRADRLSCYGYEGHETPHIDGLAAAGVRFERAQSVASWTVPSMGAMLTSLLPTQLGMVEKPAAAGRRFGWRERREQTSQVLPQHRTTLAEMLRSAGFRTAAFVNQPGLNVGEGFQQGFDDWFFPAGPGDIRRYDARKPLVARQWAPYLDRAYDLDGALVRRFDTWLAQAPDAPLFAWLHLLTPHMPYNPPPQFTDARRDLQRPARYSAEVRAADALVGEILASIDRHVGRRSSLIVLTSDHGEALGEHQMHEHGHSLHREVTSVPLLVSAPGIPPRARVAEPVRSIDILPTILELAGQPPATDRAIEGTSLVPLLAGGAASEPVYAEGMLYGSTERSLQVDGYKLLVDVDEDRHALYEVESDPLERIDLARREPERARALRNQLTQLHERLRRDYVPAETEADDAAGLEALKALGYVEEP